MFSSDFLFISPLYRRGSLISIYEKKFFGGRLGPPLDQLPSRVTRDWGDPVINRTRRMSTVSRSILSSSDTRKSLCFDPCGTFICERVVVFHDQW